MVKSLDDRAWNRLLRRIKDPLCTCTPFIGAGASASVLPSGAGVATRWSEECGFPLANPWDLSGVAQFLAITEDPMYPKEKLIDEFAGVKPPDFSAPDEPHHILAELPFPVYITTNYDDFMVQALKSAGKEPIQELCRWNSELERRPSRFDDIGFKPTSAQPVVFHLHGHLNEVHSLVLTEDDYLDFMVKVTEDPNLLPPRIQEALRGASLLFIGYRIADWNFRMIFRSLVRNKEVSLGRSHLSVQLDSMKDIPEEKRPQAREYLDRYFGENDISVYWGKAQDFALELRRRWEEFADAR